MDTAHHGRRGILGAARVEMWVHLALVVLTVASAVRYVDGHGFGDRAPLVLSAAALLVLAYAAGPLLADPARAGRSELPARAWCLALVALWLLLVLLAPSFAWVAVPLSFVALRVLPFAAAGVVVAAMTVAVVVAWSRMTGELDLTVVTGPVAVAGLAVLAYRALAEAQHTAGVLAERARLSRELHDSVAQGFSSINLLLQAAQQAWRTRPDAAREHVGQAALTARDGLEDVRRVVRDLAPAELSGTDGGGGQALADALCRSSEAALRGSDVRLQFRVHGEPVAVDSEVATALVRTARGALANVVEHAHATTAVVSLTYQPDAVALDVHDDGRGFDPDQIVATGGRGRGLAGIRERARAFGGDLVVESAPGEGTTVAVSLPAGGGR